MKYNKMKLDQLDHSYETMTLVFIQQNDGRPVVAERFIRALKIKIYEYMTPISRIWLLIN